MYVSDRCVGAQTELEHPHLVRGVAEVARLGKMPLEATVRAHRVWALPIWPRTVLREVTRLLTQVAQVGAAAAWARTFIRRR